MAKSEIKHHTTQLDADDQSIGRLASQIAKLLQGKHQPTYAPHVDSGDAVEVRNASKVRVTGSKPEGKFFYHYSGYPGGIKSVQLKTVLERNPAEALRRAVWSMLPKNRQRKARMKRLVIHN